MKKFKIIPLTQGQFTIVDAEDFPKLARYKWCAAWSPNTKSFRAMRRIVLNWRTNRGKSILMHREIVKAKKGEDVDHISSDSLDNRKSNLRKCSPSENKRNRVPHIPHSSKYKGVSWHKEERKWRARLNLDKRQVFFGRFKAEIEAAKAYDKAAKKFHGEFARTNF